MYNLSTKLKRYQTGTPNLRHSLAYHRTSGFAKITFDAWTKHLVPHLTILPMFVAMYESWQNKDFGVLRDFNLVRVPLSIIGKDKVRYRTPIIDLLHEAVLSANMSELSVETFKRAIGERGVSD